MRFSSLMSVLLSTAILGGCSHAMEIKNLSEYRSTSISPLNKRVSIGIYSTEQDIHMKYLIKCIGQELNKFSSEVIYPYSPNNSRKADVVAFVRVTPEYKGSGANFFVNFPGFLIFAPAWHGYNYKVNYDIAVELMNKDMNEKIDNFNVPIKLNVRHAEIDRAWTEISWLEVGVIALIGGVYCINYDPDVTPLVAEKAGAVVGENIAGEIINRLNNSRKFARIDRLESENGRLALILDYLDIAL